MVAGATAASMALVPAANPTRRLTLLPLLLAGGVTLWFLAVSSASFALATGAGSVVGVLQSLLLRRTARDAAAPGG